MKNFTQSLTSKFAYQIKSAFSDPKKIALTVLKYSVFFALLALFANAKTEYGKVPLAIGFFVGLVFAKQNLLILAPLYILAELTADFSVLTLLCSMTPIIILMMLYLVFSKLSKSVGVLVLTLTTLFSMIPYIVLTLLANQNYLIVSINVAVAVFFSYCCQIGCYAVLLRGINIRLSQDESITLAIILSGFALGLFSNPLFGFNLFHMFLVFSILFLSFSSNTKTPLFVAIFFGIGATLMSGDFALMFSPVLFAVTAICLKPFSRFASAFAIVLVETILLLFSSISGFDWLEFSSVTAGAILFCFIPKKVLQSFANKIKSLNGEIASRDIVNQNRIELGDKVQNLSRVFFNMKMLLGEEKPLSESFTAEKIAVNVATSHCSNCQNKTTCFSAIGGDTRNIIMPIVKSSLHKGKATILDTPPFITSRCVQIQNLLSAINMATLKSKNEIESLKSAHDSKSIVADQFGGVALVLDALAKDVKKRISMSPARENKISKELSRHNIIANDIMVVGQDNNIEVTLSVRNSDNDKLVLEKILSSALNQKMERVEQLRFMTDANKCKEGFSFVHFATAPTFSIVYGVAEKFKDGECVSGDSKTIQKIEGGKLLVALCDGMGSGDDAMNTSNSTVLLVENFYHAGFDSNLILSLVNKLLLLRDTEDYSTLDLAVIDRKTGLANIVKMGASNSFLIRENNLCIIESESLPVGALEKNKPKTVEMQLENDDIIVMVSDGISDVLDTESIFNTIEDCKSQNPQTIADALLDEATNKNSNDDCTVIALRIVKLN